MVEIGDLIFGHIKGYRPWPARVMGQANAGKFSVFFFGTYQTGELKQRDIHQYSAENIAKWGKPGKNQAFNKALKEIEENPKDISENNSYQGSLCCQSHGIITPFFQRLRSGVVNELFH